MNVKASTLESYRSPPITKLLYFSFYKCHKDYIDTEKYSDSNSYQQYLKYMGATLEETESRALREHYDVYYSRLQDVNDN